jgi:pyruvate/2-oxoglutarate dehydrogenase complex dihydrolipoamide dehydrogenase (E3) component
MEKLVEWRYKMAQNEKIIVIGGGPAGVTAALRASELGAKVTLVERGQMGGTCTNDGCVPTRVLAKAARLMRDAQQFAEYGLSGPTPELDFQKLLSRTQQVVYQMHEKKQFHDHLSSAGVSVLIEAGAVHFIDPYTIELANGKQLQADKFILCAGGRSRRLDFPGAEYALTHQDLWSLPRLPRSLVIAGAAATGCQLASIFEIFGTQVTLLERSSRIIAAEDEAVSSAIQESFQQSGVQIITGITGIERAEKSASGLELYYNKNDEVLPIQTEAVILSAGWVGNLDSLSLPAAQVETQGNFVKVDDFLRTTAPHIFAAGDITGRMMLVQSAGYEAQVAAENAVLGVGRHYEHKIVPHGGFTDPEYASVGLTEGKARERFDCAVAMVPYADLDRAIIDGHPTGFCKLIVSQENHRILGAHVVGEQALEVVEVAAAAMAADMWVEQLAELEIAYPTFTAIIGLAARKLVYDLGVQPVGHAWKALGKSRFAEWERGTSD